MHRPRSTILALILSSSGLIACAPPRLPASEDESTDEAEGSEDTTATSSQLPDTGETEAEAEDSLGFVPDLDDPLWPECDVFDQDCPTGEKCVPFASTGMYWDTFGCVPVLGEVPPGGTCTWDGIEEGTDDCDASSYCWDTQEIDGELIGRCSPMCTNTGDNPMCPPGSQCLISGGGGFALCATSCDPLLQDCLDGRACYWVAAGFSCRFPTGETGAGEPCESPTGCAGGSLCTGAEELPSCAGLYCCAPYCDVRAADPCPSLLPGSSCVDFFAPGTAPPGLETVGYCGLP